MYPKKFLNLIEMFEKLPGVGNKTASRFAFGLLDKSDEEIIEYIDILKGIKEIKRCKICGFEYIGETLPPDYICEICKHPASDFELVE